MTPTASSKDPCHRQVDQDQSHGASPLDELCEDPPRQDPNRARPVSPSTLTPPESAPTPNPARPPRHGAGGMSAMRRINRAGQSWPQPRHDPKPRFRIKVARLRATSARMNSAHRIGFKELTNEIAMTALLPLALAVEARVLVCRRGVGFVRALRLAKVRLAVTPGRRRLAEPFFGSSPEDRLLGRKLSIGAQAFKSSRRPKNAPRSTAPSPPARRVANPGTLARSRG